MWPYPWTHVGTPSHLGHMDRVAATMPSQAHAGAAQEAPDIGQWEGQDVPLVRPSSCNVKGGIPSSRRYLPTYLTFVVRVHIAGRELEGDGTSPGVWCSGTKLGMVTVQDLVIPHTNRIHILPDLPHDYPRHIPRCLPSLDRTSLWCCSTHTVSWRA